MHTEEVKELTQKIQWQHLEKLNIKSDGIELDVQFSLDEELVIIHDGDVNRTTNGKGLVKEKH